MSLLNLSNLRMAFGGQEVFSGVSAQLNDGNHIGLVGPNGTGKTTLLRLIAGQLSPLDGAVAGRSGLKIGYLPQHPTYPSGQTAFNEVYAGLENLQKIESKLRALEEQISFAEAEGNRDIEKLGMQYAELTDQYTMMGGPSAEAKIASLLHGLGIPERIWHSPMETLSGGEGNMIGLARILIGDHDLMLLDEPGNHLDFSGLEWLENFLSKSPKAFIIVSHNRYTLDRICNGIWEINHGHLETYGGNYSEYRSEKLSSELAQQAAFNRAQKDIKRLQFNIHRLKAWSSVYDNPKLAKTAKRFEKRVEDLEKIERPTGDGKGIRLRFLTKPPRGHIALETKGYGLQFEGMDPLLEDVNLLISQGERVAFVGNNGTGKSSFLKEIVENGRWENQELRVGKSVSLGYYSQLGENLNPKKTVIYEAMRLTGLLRGEAASLLHRFLFTVDDLEKYVQVLSGGEKARLQLAALVQSGADMLLLDEPTNHLDIPSREAVEDALELFPGTLVIVSHDRYFLDKLADRTFHFVPPDVTEYEGNFSEFWAKCKLKLAEISRSKNALKRTTFGKVDDTGIPKKKPKRLKFDPQRFKFLEAEIKKLEDLKPEIEAEFHKLTQKGKTTRAEHRKKRLVDLELKLEALYEEWLVLGEKKKKW